MRSASLTEITFGKVLDVSGMDAPVVAATVACPSGFDETLGEREVVSDAVSPSLSFLQELRERFGDVFVDAAERQLLVGRTEDGLCYDGGVGRRLFVGFLALLAVLRFRFVGLDVERWRFVDEIGFVDFTDILDGFNVRIVLGFHVSVETIGITNVFTVAFLGGRGWLNVYHGRRLHRSSVKFVAEDLIDAEESGSLDHRRKGERRGRHPEHCDRTEFSFHGWHGVDRHVVLHLDATRIVALSKRNR